MLLAFIASYKSGSPLEKAMAFTQTQDDFKLALKLQSEDSNASLFDTSDDDALYSALDAITDDYVYALQLQEELNKAPAIVPLSSNPEIIPLRTFQNPGSKTSIVDESWEYVDPTPDIFALFKQFNQTYFWGKLDGVEVKWSPRMTLCAGVCSYERRGGLCSVRLSLPLLKLRPRKDLVQTLLHEMIHAYLFVTQNNKDHDAHGPEFCKHMNRLNKETGAHITIYHTFHDEVELYRQHWWKCNGPCQKRPPYYGILRRATNRAPGPNDPWWNDHQKLCGGQYIKFKEPEGYKDPKKRKIQSSINSGSDGLSPKKNKVQDPTQQSITPFSGKGHVLGGSSSIKPISPTPKRVEPATSLSVLFAKSTNTGKSTDSTLSRGQQIYPKPNIATLPSVNHFPKIVSSNNNKTNGNVMTFGSRQPLGSNQATRLKSNSSSTVTITQRDSPATAASPRSTQSAANGSKAKTKSPRIKKVGSPSKLQTLRDMFSKMSPPKRWSNGKLRDSTAVRRVSSSTVELDDHTKLNRKPDVSNSKLSENRKSWEVRKFPDQTNVSANGGHVGTAIDRSGNNVRQTEASKYQNETKSLVPKSAGLANYFHKKETSSVIEIPDDPPETIPSSDLCECPVCHKNVPQSGINQHLDVCLSV